MVEWYKVNPKSAEVKRDNIIEEQNTQIDSESLENLPYYLKNTKKEDVERILKEIKEVFNN